MPSIKDVAELAGTSITTVSHVLNNTRFVSPEMKEKVLSAIEKLNYKPNVLARNLKISETKMIGVVVPDLYSAFFPVLINAIENKLTSLGYQFFISHTDHSPEREVAYVQQLIGYKVDGLILANCGAEQNMDLYKWLEDENIPVVYVDREPPVGIAGITVTTDNFKASKAATEHLFLSYERVALISPFPAPATLVQRIEGYLEACQSRERQPIMGLFDGWGESIGFKGMEKILREGEFPLGVFCTTNSVTRGAIRKLQELKIDVPKDIGIMGFDDADWTTLVRPTISVVQSQPQQIGELAVEKLMQRLENPEYQITKNLVEAHLVIRQSSQRS